MEDGAGSLVSFSGSVVALACRNQNMDGNLLCVVNREKEQGKEGRKKLCRGFDGWGGIETLPG